MTEHAHNYTWEGVAEVTVDRIEPHDAGIELRHYPEYTYAEPHCSCRDG